MRQVMSDFVIGFCAHKKNEIYISLLGMVKKKVVEVGSKVILFLIYNRFIS